MPCYQPPVREPVDPVRHRARRDQRGAQQRTGAELVRRTQPRSADSTSNSQASSSWAAKAPRLARSRCLASREIRAEHLQWRQIKIRSFRVQPATRSSTSSRVPETVTSSSPQLRTGQANSSQHTLDIERVRIGRTKRISTSRYFDLGRMPCGTRTYNRFSDQRSRPFYELMNRVGAVEPASVADIGCGPGELTAELARRWPAAEVVGVDDSPR